ncbi:MAG TPA: DUF2961 domain-containing protein [Clostridiaceae bacterium]|nr:DUF2961 domain-containing protein [Clostridiaceae bacterium]
MIINGFGNGLENLSLLSNAVTRSISAENFNGEKGRGGMALEGMGSHAARELGQGWKISPCITIKANETFVLADIKGPGVINHIWMTVSDKFWRSLVIRMYWDGEEHPSVEVPYGDFFCNGWCEYSHVNSLPVAVNPNGGMNSYWQMPFRKSARITIENLIDQDVEWFFYQIDYSLMEIPENAAYFHVQWRRSNPLNYLDVHKIADNIKGKGHYVGTYIAWQANNNGWFGEGEVKFYLDGDEKFPTICGTGTEDYFGGAWCWNVKGKYATYSTPFLGMHQICEIDGINKIQPRFGMYRWHIMDPIRFEKDLKVTIQALGIRSRSRYLPLQDDISSTAYWYQSEPHIAFITKLDPDLLEVI